MSYQVLVWALSFTSSFSHQGPQGSSSACLLDGETGSQVGLARFKVACHLSCCCLHPSECSNFRSFLNSMHRSPHAFPAFVFLLASAVSGWSQSNPATPKPGSGVPQAPITTPATAPPQTPAPLPSATVPDTTPPAQPTATPASAQPGNQADQQKARS